MKDYLGKDAAEGVALREVQRLQNELDEVQVEVEEAIAVLKPNMPENGLVDACKQVKQVAMSGALLGQEVDRLRTIESAAKEWLALVAGDNRYPAWERAFRKILAGRGPGKESGR